MNRLGLLLDGLVMDAFAARRRVVGAIPIVLEDIGQPIAFRIKAPRERVDHERSEHDWLRIGKAEARRERRRRRNAQAVAGGGMKAI